MSGRVVHFEIPFDDQERAHARSTPSAFGWTLNAAAGDALRAGHHRSERPGAAERARASSTAACSSAAHRSSGPVLVVDVEDIDATLAKIEESGGTTVSAKQAVGEMGFAAYFTDPEGNLMGLWQNA